MKKIHLFALVALFQFLLATGSAGQPVELSALDAQFQKLQKERVDEPYDGSLGKFNTSFLGALEKAIMDEKTAGNLDGVLALEAEKRRLSLASASDSAAHVPASDEAALQDVADTMQLMPAAIVDHHWSLITLALALGWLREKSPAKSRIGCFTDLSRGSRGMPFMVNRWRWQAKIICYRFKIHH